MKIKKQKVSQKYYSEIKEEIEENFSTLKGCSQACMDNNVSCDFKDCEFWINYGEDNNCDLISIQKHGQMTLREVGERLGVSYVRIKQIEDVAIKKIKKSVHLD
jgi:hypothetical protein